MKSSWDRVWIFFVIVAIGLVLSWNQVGRKTLTGIDNQGLEVLVTEKNCDIRREPCAAYGRSIAVVCQFVTESGAVLVRARLVAGKKMPLRPDSVKFSFYDDDGALIQELISEMSADAQWVSRLSELPSQATRYRVNISMGDQGFVAEYAINRS